MFAVGTAFYTLRQCPVNDRQTDAVKSGRDVQIHTPRGRQCKLQKATKTVQISYLASLALVMSVRSLGKLELTLYGTNNP